MQITTVRLRGQFGHFQTIGGRGGPSAQDIALADMISSYDVNFAKTGDPNGPGLPRWPAFTEQNEQVMVFDGDSSARTYPVLDKVEVFDAYFERLRSGK